MNNPTPNPQPPSRLLVVDDESSIRLALVHALSSFGHTAVSAADGEEGLDVLKRGDTFDAALVDIRMPRLGGIEFLEQAREIAPGMPILIMTGQASVRTAVQSLKLGAFDYLTKPFDNIFSLCETTIASALEFSRQRRALPVKVGNELDQKGGRFEKMVGRSEKMKRVYELIAGVAPTDATVLVQGETGTGKELVARAIHERSRRSRESFVALNCAALPPGLLESELFGHEKGAFTGAHTTKKGLFEEANGGTLFLDEIGEMPLALQAKLLRFIQEGEIRRVGSSRTRRIDVRLLAATHNDLRATARQGLFREDLYYRLAVVTITVPPLRERREDIGMLVDNFLQVYNRGASRQLDGISPQALLCLQNHRWEGNVRELQNVIERSTIFARGNEITVADLPDIFSQTSPPPSQASLDLSGLAFVEAKRLAIEAFERDYMHALLERTSGNISRAAREAGMDRSNFKRLLKRHKES